MKPDHEETGQQMLRRLRSMWAEEGTGGYGNQLGIVCPYCKRDNSDDSSYVHFGKPQYTSGNDHYDAQGIYGIGVRGDVITLSFSCEYEGHEWVLVLGEHKGGIFCKIILTDDGNESLSLSPIEKAFWDEWNKGSIQSYELVPQYSIGKYRVDFANIETKTAIELDGFDSHSSTEDIARDRKRQREIEKQGWHVIRFGGKEIHKDVHSCVMEVWTWIDKKVHEEDAENMRRFHHRIANLHKKA